MSKSRVYIVNPVPGGACFSSEKRAERYVKTGRAVWATPTSIRFTESDPRHQAVLEHSRTTGMGYDRVGSMTLDQIRHIPVLFPQKLR